MISQTNIRTGRHCVFNLNAHLVFVTKYRKSVFNQKALTILQIIFADVCEKFEATLVECNGETEHVHLLVNYPPKVSLSKLVNALKGVSSRLLRKHLPNMKQHYWKGVLWSPSYFAGSCGGITLEIVKQYIKSQTTPKE